MSNERYKWGTPRAWLDDQIRTEKISLQEAWNALIWTVDNDQIQDVFQEEMDRSGYFLPIGQYKKQFEEEEE